jgi:P-type Cu+ transporter
MHREISHSDSVFQQESNLALFLMTGLLGVLMAVDLLPRAAAWAGWQGLAGWPLGVGEYRFALIAAILGGARIVYGSLQGLLDGKVGADVALALACISAILINEPLVAAEVVFIGLLGECLEAFTFAQAQAGVRKIVEVFPRRCWLLRDGQEVRVFTSELRIGDKVVVKPGAKVPVDGVVLDGRSALDTSALTGESLPLDKGPGDEVLAGSVNQFGALTVEAQRVAEQTVAGRVIELTARALKDKANLERTADRLARYFLPAVLGLAALTFFACLFYYGTGVLRPASAMRLGLRQAITYSVYPTLSLLVVACPCALILATPAAIIAALGRLAGTGVLIKGGSALERLATVRAFAFDKTGTITEARLELGEVIPLADISTQELLRVAATAEQKSEHPLARLILHEAEKRQLLPEPLLDFQAHPGAGITARTSAGTLLVGTRRMMEEQGLSLPAAALAALDRLDAAGQTSLLVARDGHLLGILGARDRVRPEAAAVLAELRAIGIDPIVLLTGDRSAAARAVAQDLAFSEIHAELLPEQKAELLAKLKANLPLTPGPRPLTPGIAMVGDGINDAPALARADVGLALGGSGTDIAAEAGDIVLMGDPLRTLPLLVRLSRETVRIIRQNIIVFAFGVNAVGIVVTAWLWPLITPAGWYEQSPLAAVIYHQVGSLAVLLNSMRLLWFERTATNPGWVRVKDWARDLDGWLSRNLDIHELSHSAHLHWRGIIAASALLLLLALAGTGITVVAPDELAVVRRFGAPVEELGPGWYWRWPWPVEETARLSQQVRVVTVGFRETPEKGKATAALTWSSAHRKETRIPDEAMMITGDGNLVDLLVSVRYRVKEPRVYLFEVSEPEEVLRAATESVLRSLVAGQPFLELLTVQRGAFQDEVHRRLRARCTGATPHGLGITLEGVSILDLHPPGEVVDAYDEVAKAMELRDLLINQAQEEAVRKLKEADADSEKILAQARASRVEKVQQAEADKIRFLARHKPRRELSAAQESALLSIASDAVRKGHSPGDVEKETQRRRQDLLQRQAELTDFRLYWDALARALSGRELLLLDADPAQVRGRRNLMLFDPEQLRVPIPMFMPPDTGPARRSTLPGGATDEGP